MDTEAAILLLHVKQSQEHPDVGTSEGEFSPEALDRVWPDQEPLDFQ